MKTLITLLLFFLYVSLYSQDTIMLKNGNMYTGRVSSISDDYVKIISGTTLTQASSDEIRYVVFENSGEDAIFVNRIDIQGMDNEFIQIIGYSKGMFSNDVTINIDYGQESSYWGKRKQLITDKFGRPIEFYSMIHALNYLTERGWEFVDNYPMSSAQGSAYHYLLRRKKQIKD